MFLLDTDILSNLVKKQSSGFLIEKLDETPHECIFTSSINISEIYYGAFKSPGRLGILSLYEEKVFPNLTILSFDEKSARFFGEIKAKLEKKGKTKSDSDLRIAAITLQHRLILVTGNTKHFEDIPGLKVESWIRY